MKVCWSFAIVFFMLIGAGISQARPVFEKDLALIMGKNFRVPITATNTSQIFPVSWYNEILRSFGRTSVGNAIQRENTLQHWQLVSMRVSPCMPLGVIPSDDVSRLCWPELRLIWQPIVGTNGFADDRGVHALYDVSLPNTVSQDDLDFIATIKRSMRESFVSRESLTLSDVEFKRFVQLRNVAIQNVLNHMLHLRAFDERFYRGFGPRPELRTQSEATFRSRLVSFLQGYAQPAFAKELTAMSLPEGRRPGQINRWVFLAFQVDGLTLHPVDIALKNTQTSEDIFVFSGFQSVSRQQEDLRFIPSNLSLANQRMVASSVIRNPQDRARIGSVVADRNQILVPNTTCASCHKLNANPNDFHNFSYFLTNPQVTISPRVVNDVNWDLSWLRLNRFQ